MIKRLEGVSDFDAVGFFEVAVVGIEGYNFATVISEINSDDLRCACH